MSLRRATSRSWNRSPTHNMGQRIERSHLAVDLPFGNPVEVLGTVKPFNPSAKAELPHVILAVGAPAVRQQHHGRPSGSYLIEGLLDTGEQPGPAFLSQTLHLVSHPQRGLAPHGLGKMRGEGGRTSPRSSSRANMQCRRQRRCAARASPPSKAMRRPREKPVRRAPSYRAACHRSRRTPCLVDRPFASPFPGRASASPRSRAAGSPSRWPTWRNRSPCFPPWCPPSRWPARWCPW